MDNKKSLKKNLIYNILYQLLIVLVPLVTSPYLSRKLGAEATGLYSYVNSIAMYFILLATLGIATYGNRLIARTRNNFNELKKNFWSLYFIQFVSFLFFIVGYLIFSICYKNNEKIYIIFLFLIISGLFDITWFFQGLEDFKKIVIRNVIIKVTSMILIFVFIKSPDDLLYYCLIMTCSTLLGQIIMWPYIFKNIRICRFEFSYIKKHIKPVLILFIPCLAISIFSIMDKIMLGYICPKEELGFYEYSEKIIAIPKALISALGIAMLPRISNMVANGDDENSRKYIYITYYLVFIVSFAIAFGIASVGECFSVVYWGENYEKCGILLAILCPAFVFSALGNVIRTQFLIPNMMDKEYVIAICCGAIVNLVGNFIILKYLGVIGACLTTVLAEFIIFVMQLVLARKKISLRKEFINSIPFLIIGGIMYLVLYFINISMTNSIIKLMILVGVGAVIYILLTLFVIFISKNDGAKFIKEKIKGRFIKENA